MMHFKKKMERVSVVELRPCQSLVMADNCNILIYIDLTCRMLYKHIDRHKKRKKNS